MRLRLYIILQICTFERKKRKSYHNHRMKEMSKEVYTSLTESTVNTAIARLYATSANHKKNDYTHTSSLLAIVPLNTVDRVFDYSVTTQLLSHIYIGF